MELIVLRSTASKPWRSRKTYGMIEAVLRERWTHVRSIHAANSKDLSRLLAEAGLCPANAFIFNIGEYLDERHRRDFIPALLDEWGFAHLGSSAATVLTALDKGSTKELLRKHGIPTARSFVAEPGDPGMQENARAMGYPLFVKPLRDGGHTGVTDDSVVNCLKDLERAVHRISCECRQPSIVEEFISGDDMREFSVGIIGAATRMHFPIEIDWNRMPVKTRILSYQAAQKGLERVKRIAEGATADALNGLADATFEAVGALDYARVDIRANSKGYFVLEINIMPGLGPHSFLPVAAREMLGWEYGDLIRCLTTESLNRQGLRIRQD